MVSPAWLIAWTPASAIVRYRSTPIRATAAQRPLCPETSSALCSGSIGRPPGERASFRTARGPAVRGGAVLCPSISAVSFRVARAPATREGGSRTRARRARTALPGRVRGGCLCERGRGRLPQSLREQHWCERAWRCRVAATRGSASVIGRAVLGGRPTRTAGSRLTRSRQSRDRCGWWRDGPALGGRVMRDAGRVGFVRCGGDLHPGLEASSTVAPMCDRGHRGRIGAVLCPHRFGRTARCLPG